MKVYIYALKDPRTGATRYIGKSTNPDLRLLSHIQTSSSRRGHQSQRKKAWILELRALGLLPLLVVLEETSAEEADHREMTLIHQLIGQGVDLTNAYLGPTCWRCGEMIPMGTEPIVIDWPHSATHTRLHPLCALHLAQELTHAVTGQAVSQTPLPMRI